MHHGELQHALLVGTQLGESAGGVGGLVGAFGELGLPLDATLRWRRILDGLGFGKRRTSLTKDEFAKVVEACARIKLTLPETIEPTTRIAQGPPAQTVNRNANTPGCGRTAATSIRSTAALGVSGWQISS